MKSQTQGTDYGLRSTDYNRGFTLLEVIVSVGIFSLVLFVATTAYARFVSVERQHIGQQELQEDVRIAMEQFNREVRIGHGDTFSRLSGNDPTGFTFRDNSGTCVLYRLDNGRLIRNVADRTAATQNNPAVLADPRLARRDCSDFGLYGVNDDDELTDPTGAVTVRQLAFYVRRGEVDAEGTLLTSRGLVTMAIELEARADPATPIVLNSTVGSNQVLTYEGLLESRGF